MQGSKNVLTLDDAVVSANTSDSSTILTIKGASSAADTIDGSAITLTDRSLAIYAGAGGDTITGGAGDDVIHAAAFGTYGAEPR